MSSPTSVAGQVKQAELSQNVPGLPVAKRTEIPMDPEVFLDLYTLRLKKDVLVTDIHFRCKGGLHQAIKVANSYCKKFGYRFIHVNAFLTKVDFDEQADNSTV